MPVLSQKNRPTKRVVVLEDKKDPGWVEVYTEPSMDELMKIYKYRENPEEASARVVAMLVADWNFTDEKKKKLEITPENVNMLGIMALADIIEASGVFEKVERLTSVQKKSLSSSSRLNTMPRKAKK